MTSSLKFHQSLLRWSGFHHIVTKLSRNWVFTFVGEHDFLLHLTTFKARFLHLRLGIFVHLWLKKFLQLRVIFTNEVDFLSFVVYFYIWNFLTSVVVTPIISSMSSLGLITLASWVVEYTGALRAVLSLQYFFLYTLTFHRLTTTESDSNSLIR